MKTFRGNGCDASPGSWTQNNGNVMAGLLSAEQYGAIRNNWRALPREKCELG